MAFTPKISDRSSCKRATAGLVGSVVAFAYLCSKHASRVSKKLKPTVTKSSLGHHSWKMAPPSPSPASTPRRAAALRTPKQLLATISNKAITLVNHRKKKADRDEEDEEVDFSGGSAEHEWGDGGVWQRSILMGDKCQPLDFSGVIYYDSKGNQLSELPLRSPRASPLPGYLQKAKQ